MNHAVIVKLAYAVGVLFNNVRSEKDPELPEELMVYSSADYGQRDKVIDHVNQHMCRQARNWKFVRLTTHIHRLGSSLIIRVEHHESAYTMLLRINLDEYGMLHFENMEVQRTVALVPSEDSTFVLSRGRSTFTCKTRKRDSSFYTTTDALWTDIARVLSGMIDTSWFSTKSLSAMQAGINVLKTV